MIPVGRNAELATCMTIALIITVAVSIFTPAIGPADALGRPTLPGPVIRALRDGVLTLPHTGIVSFPSFHAVFSIIIVAAHRGTWLFWPMTLISAVDLFAIPWAGDHYVVDVIGGAAVAVLAMWITKAVSKERTR